MHSPKKLLAFVALLQVACGTDPGVTEPPAEPITSESAVTALAVPMPVFEAHVPFGNALKLLGDGGYVFVPSSPSLGAACGAVTVAGWVKPAHEVGRWRTIISSFRESGSIWPAPLYLVLQPPTSSCSGGMLYMSLAGPVVSWIPGVCLEEEVWHHVALTYDGTTVRVFKDGSVAASTTANNELLELCGNPYPIYLGFNTVWPGEVFSGALDEVRIWDRALSVEEVALLQTAASTVGDELAYWGLDDAIVQGGDAWLPDRSAYGNHGLWVFAASFVAVDIKPKSDLNCLNPGSQGDLPVALLADGVHDFALWVVPPHIDDDSSLAPTGVEASKATAAKDLNKDGLTDYMLKFGIPEMDDLGMLTEGKTLFVKGQLLDGTWVVGSDVVHLAGGPVCK